VYNDGLRNMNLLFILNKLAMPAVCLLVMVLAIPYAFARTLVPLFGEKLVTNNKGIRKRERGNIFMSNLSIEK
jgi:hypothetical protein